jgi:hypothetical protein
VANLDQTTACRAVLIEVANVLGAFRDQLVIVGGWVPELLYPNRGHIGSLDVDFAVSPAAISGSAYETIRARLAGAGYQHHSGPTHFTRDVPGAQQPVKIDFISGQYVTGVKEQAIRVNELLLNTLAGIDLAFEASEEIEVRGAMPDGTQNAVRVRVVRPEAFILIKAFALSERLKGKDAYDISFVLRHFEPNLTALADRLRPLVEKGLGLEGYKILKAKYASIDAVGPARAADTVPGTGDDIAQRQRAAYQDAQELFKLVGS